MMEEKGYKKEDECLDEIRNLYEEILFENSGLEALGALFASAELDELGEDAEKISYGTMILINMFLNHQKEKLDKINKKAIETQGLLEARAKKPKEKGTVLIP
jgi:hypothetical protein